MGKSQQRRLDEAHRRFVRENKRVFRVCYSATKAQVINKKANKEDGDSINQASKTQRKSSRSSKRIRGKQMAKLHTERKARRPSR